MVPLGEVLGDALGALLGASDGVTDGDALGDAVVGDTLGDTLAEALGEGRRTCRVRQHLVTSSVLPLGEIRSRELRGVRRRGGMLEEASLRLPPFLLRSLLV